MSQNLDKFESHYRQQLSALMDGELAPDEARFMLRRLSHDETLSGCWERWQMCGDVLRGQACAPAPSDFSDRVSRALAADPMALPAVAAAGGGTAGRRPWLQWGGGAALAASVAAVAFMIGRGQAPGLLDAPASTTSPAVVAAGDAALPANAASRPEPVALASSEPADAAIAPRPAAQVASAARPTPRDARSRQARVPAASNTAAVQAVAAVSAPPLVVPAPATVITLSPAASPLPMPVIADGQSAARPFGVETPQARPWPRSVLPQYSAASGAFNASVQVDTGTRAFYPFEPRSSVLTPPSVSIDGMPPLPDLPPPPEPQ